MRDSNFDLAEGVVMGKARYRNYEIIKKPYEFPTLRSEKDSDYPAHPICATTANSLQSKNNTLFTFQEEPLQGNEALQVNS